MNRRDFVKAAVVYKAVASDSPLQAAQANDQIGLGFIGVGIRGTILLEAFQKISGIRPVIAADVYDGHLQGAKETTNGAIATTRDHREVLNRADVDAVVIATPDHWHRQMLLDALAAGKHVYLEKPMTWSIEQGREMLAAADRSGKIVQIGSGAKSSAITAKAREIVKSGVLGKVNMVRMENNRNTPEGAWVYPVPPDASPATIDWERFLGPAPKRAFDPKVIFRWRCWWEYSGGVATDLFVHLLTLLHELMDVPAPQSVVSQGGIFRWNDGRTVPDVFNSVYEYPGFLADMYVNLCNSRAQRNTIVMGSEGTLVIENRGTLRVYPELVHPDVQRYGTLGWPKALRAQYFESLGFTADGNPKQPLPAPKPAEEVKIPRGPSHQEYFIMALRGQSPVKETALDGHHAAGAAHLANLAYLKKCRMRWDPAAGTVTEG